MNITTKTVEVVTGQASADMVLCGGHTMTSIGGCVISPPGTDMSEWVEMTQEEAIALIESNKPEE